MNRQINPAIKPRSHASPVRPTIDVGLEAIRPIQAILTPDTSRFVLISSFNTQGADPLVRRCPNTLMRSLLVLAASTAVCAVSLQKRSTTDPTQLSGKIFDFIIVGGGTAGLALAGRLAEWTNITVAVIEAGTDGTEYQDQITIPGTYISRRKWAWIDLFCRHVLHQWSDRNVLVSTTGSTKPLHKQTQVAIHSVGRGGRVLVGRLP